MRIDQRVFKEITMKMTEQEKMAVIDGLVKMIREAGYCIEKKNTCDKIDCCKNNDDTQA